MTILKTRNKELKSVATGLQTFANDQTVGFLVDSCFHGQERKWFRKNSFKVLIPIFDYFVVVAIYLVVSKVSL